MLQFLFSILTQRNRWRNCFSEFDYACIEFWIWHDSHERTSFKSSLFLYLSVIEYHKTWFGSRAFGLCLVFNVGFCFVVDFSLLIKWSFCFVEWELKFYAATACSGFCFMIFYFLYFWNGNFLFCNVDRNNLERLQMMYWEPCPSR